MQPWEEADCGGAAAHIPSPICFIYNLIDAPSPLAPTVLWQNLTLEPGVSPFCFGLEDALNVGAQKLRPGQSGGLPRVLWVPVCDAAAEEDH